MYFTVILTNLKSKLRLGFVICCSQLRWGIEISINRGGLRIALLSCR